MLYQKDYQLALEYAADVSDYSINSGMEQKKLFLLNYLLEKLVKEYKGAKSSTDAEKMKEQITVIL